MADVVDLAIVVRARDLLTAELKRMGVSVQELSRTGEAAFARVGAATGAAARGIDLVEKEAREAGAALRAAGDGGAKAASTIGTAFQAVGASIKSALLPILPIVSLAGAAFAATDAIRGAAEFESALAGISAEADITGNALGELKRQALETTRALGISEVKAAPALFRAVTDGARDAAEGVAIFDAAAELATATSGDLSKTVSVLNSVLLAFRAQGLDAADAADQLFAISFAGGNVNVDELASGIGAVLPLVQGLGASFEDIAAIIIAATQAGGGFEQGLQGVRSVIGALTRENDEAATALAGVDYSSAAIRARGLVPVLQDIARELGGDAEAIRRVFPDARAFGTIMALLANDGRGLSSALDDVRASAGGVESALGRRFRSEAEQLRVVFNGLRSEFAQAFGGAFFAAIGQAVDAMGGMEKATETVGTAARNMGSAFGLVFPAIVQGIRVATIGLQGFVQTADFLRDSLLAFQGIKLFSTDDQGDLDEVNAALRQVEDSLGRLRREGELVDLSDLRESLANIPQGTIELDAALKSGDVEAGLDALLGRLRRERVEIEATINGERGLDELGRRLKAAALEFSQDLAGSEDELFRIFQGIAGTIDSALSGSGEEVKRTFAVVSEEFEAAQRSVNSYRATLDLVAEASKNLSPDVDLTETARGLRTLQDDFGRAADNAESLKQELLLLAAADVNRVEGEIAKVSTGLRDARSVAQLLGLTGEEALERIGAGADKTRLEELKAELDGLKRRMDELRSAPPIVQEIEVVAKAEGRNLRFDKEFSRIFGSDAIGPVVARAFEFGVELAVQVRSGLVQEAQRKRDNAIEELFAPPSPLVLAIVTEGVDAGVRALRALALEREQLEGQAIALNVSIVGLSNEQAREAITNAFDRELLTIELGVDEPALQEAALLAAERATAEVNRAELEREAIRFNVNVNSETLEADLIRARAEVEKFAQENPFANSVIQQGAQGLAQAFGDIASGSRSAEDAFRDFGRSFIAQITQMIAQALILRAVFTALGVPVVPGVNVPFAKGAAIPAARGIIYGDEPGMAVRAYARGGSPHIESIVSAPTLERASRLAGSAIIPLSGGGVATTDGRRLPMVRTPDGLAVRRYAKGEHMALFGEAGPEALPRLRRTRDGRPGILAEGGDVLPLARTQGGRLGVQAYQHGGSFGVATGGSTRVVSVPISINVSAQRGEDRELAAVLSDPRLREQIEALVVERISSSPGYRARVRGDRV